MNNILKTERDIEERVTEISSSINKDYQSDAPIEVICLLNGGSVFCSDLIRKIERPVNLSHFGFNSHANPTGFGDIQITLDIQEPIVGKDVIIVEGLIISGRTPKYIFDLFHARGAKSLQICAVGLKSK